MDDGTSQQQCCLCGFKEDDQLKFGQRFILEDFAVHHFCMLFSPNLAQNGKDDEGAEGFLPADIKSEVARCSSIICCYCQKGGATGFCMSTKCNRHYHVGCAIQADGLLQFFGKFRSFCVDHRPRQNVLGRESGESCGICLERTDPEDGHHVLWTPCCRHFFHRPCLQRMAYHFGYFFYCPGCRNKDNISGFLKHMRHFGIFVPKRDASWEMVPNAFDELLERNVLCDVRYCLCNKGRTYKEDHDSPWRLCVCDTCGSAGTHQACSDLAPDVVGWVCEACSLEPSPPAGSRKLTLRDFLEQRVALSAASKSQGGEGSSRGPVLPGTLELHEVLSELDRPEELVRFSVSPNVGLSIQTRPVSDIRRATRESGGRPVTFSPHLLLPEVVISQQDLDRAEGRLQADQRRTAAEAGGPRSSSQTRPAAGSGCRLPAAGSQTAGCRAGCRLPGPPTAHRQWAERVCARNMDRRRPAGRPQLPNQQLLQQPTTVVGELPAASELRAALSSLQCPDVGCQADFQQLGELTYHYQSHTGQPLFYCRVCREPTSQWGSIHVLDHHPELPAEEWATYVDSSFQRGQATMVCLLLGLRGVKVALEQGQLIAANWRALLAGGGLNKTGPSPPPPAAAGAADAERVCEQCHSVLGTARVIVAHAFLHSAEAKRRYRERRFSCGSCHFATNFNYLLTRHRALHHRPARPPGAVAGTAGAAAETRPAAAGGLTAGPTQATGQKRPFVCPRCGKTNISKKRLQMHMNFHKKATEDKTRNLKQHCPVCFYGASRTSSIERHLFRTHGVSVDRYKGKCPTCKLTTYNQQRHRCAHVVSRDSQRSVREGGSPSPKASVQPAEQRAEKTVALLSVRRLACQACGKTGSRDVVRRHMYWHTATALRRARLRPARCPLCHYASSLQSEIAAHLVWSHRKASASYRSACAVCGELVYNAEAHAEWHEQGAAPAAAGVPGAQAGPDDGRPQRQPRGSAGQTVSSGALMAWGDSQARYDCPFCDAFFDSRRMYLRHMTLSHLLDSCRPAADVCRFKFCRWAASATHELLLHKSAADRPFRCSQCDSTYSSVEELREHTAWRHADESVPTYQLRGDGRCWCTNLHSGVTLATSKQHLITYHSVLIRGFPGPRRAPYSCPRCWVRLDYDELMKHMIEEHAWRFKESGDDYLVAPKTAVVELACPVCEKTLGFAQMQQHLRTVHSWVFLSSQEARRESEKAQKKGEGSRSSVAAASRLVKRAAGLKTAASCRAGVAGAVQAPGPAEAAAAAEPSRAVSGEASKSQPAVSGKPRNVPLVRDLRDNPRRLDCPFCDAFFLSRSKYASHARTAHSGLMAGVSKLCEYKYCWDVETVRHCPTYHKGRDGFVHKCSFCDASYDSRAKCLRHTESNHSSQIKMGVQVDDAAECACDVCRKFGGWYHLVRCHSVQVRSYPGPRARPYSCPQCIARLPFEKLLQHLRDHHRWQLKDSGQEAFGRHELDNRNFQDAVSAVRTAAGAGPPPAVAVGYSGSVIPGVIACPFCDKFFQSTLDYRRHAEDAHSGRHVPDQLCPVAYCYAAPSHMHVGTCHKAASRRHPCGLCDAAFLWPSVLNRHEQQAHCARMLRPDGGPFEQLCSCAVNMTGAHLLACHSVAIRGWPGPGAQPYQCPVCETRLPFEALTEHLCREHCWRLKTTGRPAFSDADQVEEAPALGPAPAAAAASRPPPAAVAASVAPRQDQVGESPRARRSAAGSDRRLRAPEQDGRHVRVFECHYCPMSSNIQAVMRHQWTAHQEAHAAFMKFAKACWSKRAGYRCPFCSWKTTERWRLKTHMSVVEKCRSCLGPDAFCWLGETADEAGSRPRTKSARDSSANVDRSSEAASESPVNRDPRTAAASSVNSSPSAEATCYPSSSSEPALEATSGSSVNNHPALETASDASVRNRSAVETTSDASAGNGRPTEATAASSEVDSVLSAAAADWSGARRAAAEAGRGSPADAVLLPEDSSGIPAQGGAHSSADLGQEPAEGSLEGAAAAAAPAGSASGPGQTPFECLKCSERFSQKSQLIAHSDAHHGVSQKKRKYAPDSSQPRIDWFFKRLKADTLN